MQFPKFRVAHRDGTDPYQEEEDGEEQTTAFF